MADNPAAAGRSRRDLTPLRLTDEEWDALAGLGEQGVTAEMLAEAQAWGTPEMRALNAAEPEEEE